MAASGDYWSPLGVLEANYADMPPRRDGVRVARHRLRRCGERDRPARWLTASMVALGVLAGASAVVSYSAQYRMVLAAKAVAPAGHRLWMADREDGPAGPANPALPRPGCVHYDQGGCVRADLRYP